MSVKLKKKQQKIWLNDEIKIKNFNKSVKDKIKN
jgi:hypothetical protein